MKQWMPGMIALLCGVALVLVLRFGVFRVWGLRADAAGMAGLRSEIEGNNKRSANGLSLRLSGMGHRLIVTLLNDSRGAKRVYPPLRQIDLFVRLYDHRGTAYEPAMQFVGHPSDPGDREVKPSPPGATWSVAITRNELQEEFADLDGAMYIVAVYRYRLSEHTKGTRKPGQAEDAEVWSEPFRLASLY